MNYQISILGLGQIGASFGLALEAFKNKITRVGYDSSRTIAREAKQLGAVDVIPKSLKKTVRRADLVILALPFHEIHPTLQEIAGEVPQGGLVIDTSPLKQPVIRWMEEILPEGIFYVGLTPTLQAAYLQESVCGIQGARADLFSGCQMAVTLGSNPSSDAVEAATQLIGLVGAEPIFADAVEVDGLMSRTHLLPQVMAASLLRITQQVPGWSDARKLTGKAYTQITSPVLNEQLPAALASALVHNQENTTRLINELIAELIRIREQAEQSREESLAEDFADLQQARERWWQEREVNLWTDHPAPSISKESMLKNLLGFRSGEQKGKKAN